MEQDLVIDPEGWLVAAERHESPHYNERPDEDAEPHVVVLHNISLPPNRFGTGLVRDLFMGELDTKTHPDLTDLEGLRVSSHFFIARDGRIEQFVSCAKRAWHAGVSRFNGRDNCNDFLGAIDARYGLSYIVGHSDIAPGRKTDPGPHFDWVRLNGSRSAFGSPQFAGAAARLQLSILEQSFARA